MSNSESVISIDTRRVSTLLFASSRTTFLATIFGALILKVGIWPMPDYADKLKVIADPLTNPWPGDPLPQYHMWSWLMPAIAHAVDASSVPKLFLLNLLWTLAFFVTAAVVAFRRFPDKSARIALLVLLMLPASTTSLLWVGGDGLVLLMLLVVLAWPRRLWLTALLGIALGAQHFEQGLVGAVLLLTSLIVARLLRIERPIGFDFSLTLIASVVAGYVGLRLLFAWQGGVVEAGRSTWVETQFDVMLSQFFHRWQVIAFSILGVAWLILALNPANMRRREQWPIGVVAVLTLCVMPIVFDQTRVAAMVTFPTLAAWWVLRADFLTKVSRGSISVLWIVWLFVPVIWVWNGIPRWSVLPYGVEYILGLLTGSPGPGQFLGWPFAP